MFTMLHQPMAFSAIERYFRLTQTFFPLAGAASVMVVAAPTDPADWAS
jgi:ureidoglycolate hydrolase